MGIALGNCEEISVADKGAEFHAGDEIVPFLQDELVFYWWEGWEAVVVGVVEVVGDKV
jgi:hypothetical protein